MAGVHRSEFVVSGLQNVYVPVLYCSSSTSSFEGECFLKNVTWSLKTHRCRVASNLPSIQEVKAKGKTKGFKVQPPRRIRENSHYTNDDPSSSSAGGGQLTAAAGTGGGAASSTSTGSNSPPAGGGQGPSPATPAWAGPGTGASSPTSPSTSAGSPASGGQSPATPAWAGPGTGASSPASPSTSAGSPASGGQSPAAAGTGASTSTITAEEQEAEDKIQNDLCEQADDRKYEAIADWMARPKGYEKWRNKRHKIGPSEEVTVGAVTGVIDKMMEIPRVRAKTMEEHETSRLDKESSPKDKGAHFRIIPRKNRNERVQHVEPQNGGNMSRSANVSGAKPYGVDGGASAQHPLDHPDEVNRYPSSLTEGINSEVAGIADRTNRKASCLPYAIMENALEEQFWQLANDFRDATKRPNDQKNVNCIRGQDVVIKASLNAGEGCSAMHHNPNPTELVPPTPRGGTCPAPETADRNNAQMKTCTVPHVQCHPANHGTVIGPDFINKVLDTNISDVIDRACKNMLSLEGNGTGLLVGTTSEPSLLTDLRRVVGAADLNIVEAVALVRLAAVETMLKTDVCSEDPATRLRALVLGRKARAVGPEEENNYIPPEAANAISRDRTGPCANDVYLEYEFPRPKPGPPGTDDGNMKARRTHVDGAGGQNIQAVGGVREISLTSPSF